MPTSKALTSRSKQQSQAKAASGGARAGTRGEQAAARERISEPTAPVTLEVFLDLKDPDSRSWFLNQLPAIVHDRVRAGALRLEYRAYKTNTFRPQVFVNEQNRGARRRHPGQALELHRHPSTTSKTASFTGYVTEPYLEDIARQSPA